MRQLWDGRELQGHPQKLLPACLCKSSQHREARLGTFPLLPVVHLRRQEILIKPSEVLPSLAHSRCRARSCRSALCNIRFQCKFRPLLVDQMLQSDVLIVINAEGIRRIPSGCLAVLQLKNGDQCTPIMLLVVQIHLISNGSLYTGHTTLSNSHSTHLVRLKIPITQPKNRKEAKAQD